jgi:beta-ureidopropionase
MSIRVAQIKIQPKRGDLAANHDALMDTLAALAPHKPDVVVTPEGFLDGYVSVEDTVTRENISGYAVDPQTSHNVHAAAQWAREHRAWVIYGCARLADSAVYNSALIINRMGTLAGIYDKVQCQTHDLKYKAGNRLPVFDSDFGPFGVLICADRRWPETVRTLAIKGARVIFNPTYGMHDELNLCMMRTRAYESEVFIVFTHPLQALITDPRGNVVRNIESESAPFAVTDIDLSLVDQVRAGNSAHLRDRRTDIYGL